MAGSTGVAKWGEASMDGLGFVALYYSVGVGDGFFGGAECEFVGNGSEVPWATVSTGAGVCLRRGDFFGAGGRAIASDGGDADGGRGECV